MNQDIVELKNLRSAGYYDEDRLRNDLAANCGRPYQRCSITVMDTIADPNISFDKNGVCNYYFEYQQAEKDFLLSEPERSRALENIITKIKEHGKNKKYDCLIGVSGGVDSTYVAWLTKKFGLRPLAVHLDNGWDSELAVMNIENIIKRLNIDLFTLVVNWEEFKDIQLSYLKASVVDIEVVSDHAIFSTMYRLANEHKIPYILSGTNVVTEFIMPSDWLYSKMDYANLKSIHDTYGKLKRDTYPSYNFFKHIFYNAFLRLNPVSILNFIDYNKKEAKETITSELGWRDYGGKHYESIFTKFYQAYILPAKFHIDKRKAHYSTLICSGQMTREEALQELRKPLYSPDELQADKEYVMKKFGLKESEFKAIMEER
ncbi:MAG TPA: N-acetyl sugar amidotransferase, partial [Chitinophagaceae bacterium]|nr:N-acetyl sugar amidotransferase [Chitinophagaceae bacterium]